jgi:phosphoribosylamine--glycine ligase
MITNEGPKVIEYNCRFGDPETQAVLPLLKTDFMDVCRAVLDEKVDQLSLNWKPKTAVCVVLASSGYPVKYEKGYEIHLNTTPDSKLFYAGVGSIDEKLITNGGRVLNVVGIAESLTEARAIAYRAVEQVQFTGKTYRNDIGLRVNDLHKDDIYED